MILESENTGPKLCVNIGEFPKIVALIQSKEISTNFENIILMPGFLEFQLFLCP